MVRLRNMKVIIIYILGGLLMAGSIYGIFIYSSTEPLETDLLATVSNPVEKLENASSTDCSNCPEIETCEPIIQEVIKEVEIIKEIEVIKEVIKEVPVEKIVYQTTTQECSSCPTCPVCSSCPTCPVCEESSIPEVAEGNITMSSPASNQILFTAIGEPFEFEYLIFRNTYNSGSATIVNELNRVSMVFPIWEKEDWGHGSQCTVIKEYPTKFTPECSKYADDYNVYSFWNKRYDSTFQEYRESNYSFTFEDKVSFLISVPNVYTEQVGPTFELVAIKFKGLNSGKIVEFR